MSQAVGNKHPVDQMLPVGRLAVLGLQHVLVMYAGCVAVPLIVGGALKLDASTIAILVNADLFVAGVITIIQSLGIGRILGVRLPVVAGATFAALNPMILIGAKYGLPAVYGAFLAAGVFGLLVAKPFAKIIHLFPPLVTGTVITVIGLSLIDAGAGLIAGNDEAAPGYGALDKLALAAAIILLIVLVNRFARGFVASLSVLIGLVFGVIVAAFMGLVDFSAVGEASWFGLARPFYFGPPEFQAAAIVSMCTVMLIIYVESTADMLAVGEAVGRRPSENDIARGLAADGLSGVLAGVFNSFLDTAFAQNVGLVQVTRVRSRFVVTAAGVILVLLGLVPKLGEIIAAVPGPVIGAAALVMFATVTAVGIRSLRRVDFDGTNNLLIIAVSIGVGMIPVVAPAFYTRMPDELEIIFGSSITTTVIVVFVLNLLFNGWSRPTPADSAATPADTASPGASPGATDSADPEAAAEPAAGTAASPEKP
ncbi:xanthine/uracil permease [Actinoplanes philippinensis]|uniref:Nucleobase:cation symporter-2, NCS2 family n=1 Tax=Actinoplanes philippinensis TaxID=35752 RepID=A0A1I2GXD3_9ACTN|nr:nucleobase:cation symporter-2 family protein [Actinoplanes philippinensis]GIE78164.1 xanthine/uracil permease [Actinoplanes philippinensis]SFF21739.1 nucleobase:cation symporter-2, NCS2 family [Actinoplanes philippinensis]